MPPGSHSTYIQYTLLRASQPFEIVVKALANYRDHHHATQNENWQMTVTRVSQGIRVEAFAEAVPFYLLTAGGFIQPTHQWYEGFDLALERYRGLGDRDDHLHIASISAELAPGESFAIVASTDAEPELDIALAWNSRQNHELDLRQCWQTSSSSDRTPVWIEQLVLAADQFVVTRPVAENPNGKTVIAGYPWFGDWGRDTAIALPGLTLATGRPEIAREILLTFGRYSDRGMLPNVFPERGEMPQYNTVDGALWYVEAVRAYLAHTGDREFLETVFPTLQAIIDWHQCGTRYGIQVDPADGLLRAGEAGTQLTWMDAKIGDWVITPRIGKPIEINALWYNALRVVADCARQLGQSDREYDRMANVVAAHFHRFWHGDRGYCYDVLDTPTGDDDTLRPNQIFAVSLPDRATTYPALLDQSQRKAIVTAVARHLLTSYGLRSLHPDHPDYCDRYGGDAVQRDRSYHQGPVWGWLLGPFVRAYIQTGGTEESARQFLAPFQHHQHEGCVGTLSEIFDGSAPFACRGAFAQAWTVAETIHTWSWLAGSPTRLDKLS